MSAPDPTVPVPTTPEEIPGLVADAFNCGDPESLMALYEPGAVLAVPPGGERATGLDAIRTAIQPLFGRVHSARISLVRTLQTDDLAMTHAEWVLTGPDGEGDDGEGDDGGGTAEEMVGRGTVVSRRQPDGTWRIVIDDPVTG